MIGFPHDETLVATLDPESGLYVPARETIIASLAPRLWTVRARYGDLVTAVSSPAIPPGRPLTAATWPILMDAPGDRLEHIQVLQRAARPRVRGYRHVFGEDDLEQEVFRAILEITLGWSRTWTMGEAFARLRRGFGGMPEYVRRYIKDLAAKVLTQKRLPYGIEGEIIPLLSWDAPALTDEEGNETSFDEVIEVGGQRARLGGVDLFRAEAQVEHELLIERVRALGDPVLSGYIELKLRDPEMTYKERCKRVGVSTVTMWKKLQAVPGAIPAPGNFLIPGEYLKRHQKRK